MRRIFYFILLIPFLAFSQVGINTMSPDVSSILDIFSKDKGLLIPRVTLTDVNDVSTIPSPAKSLMVYNNGSVGLPEGFYFWDGAQWESLNGNLKNAWVANGNTITDPSNALGTNNNIALRLKTNGEQVANFHPLGGISIGYSASATESNGVAIGRSSNASSLNNVAIGVGSASSGGNAFALGTYSVASGDFGAAVGTEASASGQNATAFGHLAKASGNETVAIGGGSKAEFLSAVALGPYAEATAVKSFALGPNTKASAENSFALGIGAEADVANTVIIGEVKTGVVDITPVNVGIGTKSPKARLDVNGKFKLGEKGNVLKGISGFSQNIATSTSVAANSNFIVTFIIPLTSQPSTTSATINYALPHGTNDAISISWAKLNGVGNLRVKFRNESGAAIDINGVSVNFSIIEY